MEKHTVAVLLDTIKQNCLKIKSISGSAEIDRLSVEASAKASMLGDILGVSDEMSMILERRIEGTN